MQNRICKHLTHPRELYVFPENLGPRQPHQTRIRLERGDETSLDLCCWFHNQIVANPLVTAPPRLVATAGGGTPLHDGDCDHCPCFEPVETPPWPK